MRIGIYDPYLDDLGGGEKYMMTIAQCLSKKNKVEILWDTKEDVEAVAKRFSLDLSNVSLAPNIFTPETSLFKRLLATKNYDALIVLSDGSIPLVSSRLYLHIQQPLSQMQISSLFDKLKLSRVAKIFCNSIYTKSYIDKAFSLRTSVLYPPVSIHPKEVKRENSILHVGRFRSVDGKDYKKQSMMIQAYKEMVDNGLRDWTFIIGVSVQKKDTEAFEKMRQSAKGYPIEFVINETNDALWEVYSKAKIYWHASGLGEDLQKHPELAEHFGISTVEAMGAGVVPVVIKAGGQKEIVTNGENGFLWDSLEGLKEQTLQLIKNPTLLERLSVNAKKRAQDFTGERFCKEVKELIR